MSYDLHPGKNQEIRFSACKSIGKNLLDLAKIARDKGSRLSEKGMLSENVAKMWKSIMIFLPRYKNEMQYIFKQCSNRTLFCLLKKHCTK